MLRSEESWRGKAEVVWRCVETMYWTKDVEGGAVKLSEGKTTKDSWI